MEAVELGLFFLIAEPENIIGDSVIVLLIGYLLDKLFLQVFPLCLNVVRLVHFFSVEISFRRVVISVNVPVKLASVSEGSFYAKKCLQDKRRFLPVGLV